MEVLKENIRQQIENGTTTFITSASEGYELNAAKYILQLKAENRDVHLIIVRPYEGAYVFWRVKPILERVIAGADMVKYVCEQKEDYYAELLDEWIVSHCATILCVTCRRSVLYITSYVLYLYESRNIPTFRTVYYL